jgi:hypothetical protein
VLSVNFFQAMFRDDCINKGRDYGVFSAYSGISFNNKENTDICSPTTNLEQLTFKDSLDILKAYVWQQKVICG